MILEKRENGLWWFYDEFYTGGFTPYPFGCIIDKSANTFVITKENRPSYPKAPLPVEQVQIRVLPSTSLETYTTGELLENRLLALEFPVFSVSSSNGLNQIVFNITNPSSGVVNVIDGLNINDIIFTQPSTGIIKIESTNPIFTTGVFGIFETAIYTTGGIIGSAKLVRISNYICNLETRNNAGGLASGIIQINKTILIIT